MRIKEVEDLLTKWFVSCLKGDSFPFAWIDTNFSLEDGMGLHQYRNYEVNNFKEVAQKFDLDEGLYAKVKNWFVLDNINKNHALVYVYNKQGKFVFKVNMTVAYKDYGYVISSNDSFVQIVPKYSLFNNEVDGIGLAVLPINELTLKSVYCPKLTIKGITQTVGFMDENFYSVKFDLPNIDLKKDNFFDFRILLKDKKTGKIVTENKRIILDAFNSEHKPFVVDGKNLVLLNEKYPVSLFTQKNDLSEILEYPRNISICIDDYSRIVVTDAQDNDWHIK